MSDKGGRKNETPRLGAKIRALRRREGLSQAHLAERLGISASYLNLIENNRRPLPASILIRIAQLFAIDLAAFAAEEDTRSVSALAEVFADPMFEENDVLMNEVRELVVGSPNAARAIVKLYHAFQASRDLADDLSSRLFEGELTATPDLSRLPSEEVSELIQRNLNHFPELETAAEDLWRVAALERDDLFTGLVRYTERELGAQVRIVRAGTERGRMRHFDPHQRLVSLSELLPTRSRKFQLAHQIGLLRHRDLLERAVQTPELTTDESRALARVALGSYFAAAVMMPYEAFLGACRETRYDLDVVGRRFGTGFEQVCHRVTTLRRPGSEGIPFHMCRIDVAGNISKRFSASGIQIPRFSGLCPRWNVFAAFSTPGMIRIQISHMTDGSDYFCLARTVQQDSQGYHAQSRVHAVGLGCQVEHARHLVYADGFNLERLESSVPVGVTCRLCARSDCEQRAFPSLTAPLRIDENVRGPSIYSPGAT